MKVALDAGHGKTTPGKRSFDGSLMEYEFNHDVTSRIKAHLERLGITAYLTSPNAEIDPTLTERCKRANNSNSKLFVSIHANANGSNWNSAAGWEIYCHKKAGEAYEAAKCIESESIPFLGVKNRGIKTSDFAVLVGTKMPAVLIEHGFYTNKEECALLLSDAFREKCAVADAKGIAKYFGIKWVQSTVPKDIENILYVLLSYKIITDDTYWRKCFQSDSNVKDLAGNMIQFISDKKLNPVPVVEHETNVNDAVASLSGYNILAQKKLWLDKLNTDHNAFSLVKKFLDFIIKYGY